MNLLERTCLKPSYSLRKQLFISFGCTITVSILLLILLGVAVVRLCSILVETEARNLMSKQVNSSLSFSSQYVANAIDTKFEKLENAVSLLTEALQDRFVGYPDAEGYDDDSHVPFRDMDSKRNVYPLNSPPLQFDWHPTSNINEDNYEEHLQHRNTWYPSAQASTDGPGFFMQGTCDPTTTDENLNSYYPNCTAANNDVFTGGVVRPTSTNWQIFHKGSDLGWLLKALYEGEGSIRDVGYYFANEGAGSLISFPRNNILSHRFTYVSTGCDWMRAPNPFDNTTNIGTEEEIANCHPEGEVVHFRDYNPMERAWCRYQAMNPMSTTSFGPFEAAGTQRYVINFGQAIFDRLTHKFIACTLIALDTFEIRNFINSLKVNNASSIAVIRWDEVGTVVSSTDWDPIDSGGAAGIAELEEYMGIDQATFTQIRSDIVFNASSTNIYNNNGKIITFNPIPPPPPHDEYYDESYNPEYMVIMSIDDWEVYDQVDAMIEEIARDEIQLMLLILISGFVGILMVNVVIWLISRHLMKPLRWMRRVAKQIIDNAGGDLGVGLDPPQSAVAKCSPETELDTLSSDFAHMLYIFSGKGPAKVAALEVKEVKNMFRWKGKYQSLYTEHLGDCASTQSNGTNNNHSTTSKSSLHGHNESTEQSAPEDDTDIENAFDPFSNPPKVNLFPNIVVAETEAPLVNSVRERKRMTCSPLFWWITGLIAIPTLITMVIIGFLVGYGYTSQLPVWLSMMAESSVHLEQDSLIVASRAGAMFLQERIGLAANDLYVYSRVAGWLLFGGLARAQSFTEIITGVDQCKDNYPDFEQCSYFRGNLTPCDCKWQDSWEDSAEKCTNDDAENKDSRYSQKRWYAGQSRDANPRTGERSSIARPLENFPNETMWWDSISELPGASKGNTSSGYSTTYDRMRVLSAMAVVEFPLYNYERRSSAKHLGSYIGLEADGMVTGYSGCKHEYIEFPGFQSSEANRAAEINPDLCPLGKYGFDFRCTGWHGAEPGIQNGYIASDASELTDPATGIHVGETRMDYRNNILQEDWNTLDDGIDIVLIGPDGRNAEPRSGRESFMSIDTEDTSNDGNGFTHDIDFGSLARSITGTSGNITLPNGLFLAYAPVNMRNAKPLWPSDFSRGVNVSEITLFSFGLIVSESHLLAPFEEIQSNVLLQMQKFSTALIAVIVVTAVIVFFITNMISLEILKPIIHLTSILRHIKSGSLTDDIPKLPGTVLEVSQVNDSFEKLYTVVRFSNPRFFACGDVEHSKQALEEARELFKNLGNEKALGIASNNLGALYLREQMLGPVKSGKHEEKCRVLFDESIRIGEMEAESAEGSEFQGDYKKQLANRYFNRGMFCIITGGREKIDSGKRDIMKALELDKMALALWKVESTQKDRDFDIFESTMGRARGILYLMANYEVGDTFDVAKLIVQAEGIINKNFENPSSKLFENIRRAGRRQQLCDLSIQYNLLNKNLMASARIALKMLVEDEYVIDSVFANAVAVVNQYFKDTSKNAIFCLDCSASMVGSKIKRAKEGLNLIYDRYCRDEDFVGFVPFNNKLPLPSSFPLQRKAEFKYPQKQHLNNRVKVAGGSNLYHALEYSMNMTTALSMNHTWIFALTDGDSWDEPDSFINNIRSWNAKHTNKIHVVIVGIDVNKKVERTLKQLCSISTESIYIKFGYFNKIGKIFEPKESVISTGGVTLETY